MIPRWEWRTFGSSFGPAEDRFAGLPVERVQEGSELYLLSRESDASVKLRAGALDVKQLQSVNDDGLEQWKPVLNAGFPLPASELGFVLEALGSGSHPLERPAYTLDQLLDEVVRPSPQLMAVDVKKRRNHYTVGGCMAELTELETDHGATRTIAVESPDPAAVIAAVRDLGLGTRPNVSMARGLKALAGFGNERFAVIDVGTNSVKFHVGERSDAGAWRTVVDRAEITRLGQGLAESGRLDAEAVDRTTEAIASMTSEASGQGVVAIAAVGTAGLRLAPDSAAFLEAVKARGGVEIEIISGDEEGRLAYLAATSSLALGDGFLAVFDSGGGSTQFTFGHADKVEERFSVDVGAVRISERYGLDRAVSEDALDSALAGIGDELSVLDGRQPADAVVAIGGTATNLAAVKHELSTYDGDIVQGTVLDRAEIDRQIELYRTRTADERRQIVGLQPKRAEVILAGACIVRTVIDKLGVESATVSDRGLRHGVLIARFGR
jgi:exopolyphosphatase / guanosine-5'-triphosphate,3'-diphosphate pyrophosphatase